MSTNEALFQKGNLRHAYLLVGDQAYWRVALEKNLKSFFKIDNLTSCPDIWWQSYESFGIKDAHNLIEKEARHGFGQEGRFFVLEIASATPEAQNALLKTFEEPADDAHFFIIARSAEMFLPTLRSRLVIVSSGVEVVSCITRSDFDEAVKGFLKLDYPDRLDFIQKEFLKKKEINKNAIIDFVSKLEQTLHAQIDFKKMTKDEEIALHELIKCQRYLRNPRSSSRLILEHLSLIIPN